MSDAIRFTVRGEPKGQPRPRAFARKMGNKFVARVYDAGTAEAWKSEIAAAAQGHIPREPITGPVSMEMKFFFKRPKSHYRSGRRANELRDDAPDWHTAKPDADNLAKAVKDCCKTLGFFKDDSQVCVEKVFKWYPSDGSFQGAELVIEPLPLKA